MTEVERQRSDLERQESNGRREAARLVAREKL
jgi:hypothetical protein